MLLWAEHLGFVASSTIYHLILFSFFFNSTESHQESAFLVHKYTTEEQHRVLDKEKCWERERERENGCLDIMLSFLLCLIVSIFVTFRIFQNNFFKEVLPIIHRTSDLITKENSSSAYSLPQFITRISGLQVKWKDENLMLIFRLWRLSLRWKKGIIIFCK